jgi:hypothetical protein
LPEHLTDLDGIGNGSLFKAVKVRREPLALAQGVSPSVFQLHTAARQSLAAAHHRLQQGLARLRLIVPGKDIAYHPLSFHFPKHLLAARINRFMRG